MEKIRTPKISVFVQKMKKLRGIFFKRIIVDNRLSEHLKHHECNNMGTFKRGRCLFMMGNPERCTDLFVVMLKLEDGWMGQNKSESCSNLGTVQQVQRLRKKEIHCIGGGDL